MCEAGPRQKDMQFEEWRCTVLGPEMHSPGDRTADSHLRPLVVRVELEFDGKVLHLVVCTSKQNRPHTYCICHKTSARHTALFAGQQASRQRNLYMKTATPFLQRFSVLSTVWHLANFTRQQLYTRLLSAELRA